MSKKSRERRLNFEIRDLRKHIRMFDYVSKTSGYKAITQKASIATLPVVIDATQVEMYLESNDLAYEFQDVWANQVEFTSKECFKYGSCRPPYEWCFVEFNSTYGGDKWMANYMSKSFPNMHGCLCSCSEDYRELVLLPFYKYSDSDRCFETLTLCTINLDDNGMIAHENDIHLERPSRSNDDDRLMDWRDVMEHSRTIIGVTLATFTFLNCKNIALIDKEPDAKANAVYQRYTNTSLVKYKTLGIQSFGTRTEDSSDPKEYQGIMPLHLRRGNFAHYSEDKPLFGKYVGTFWRPATAVGERKNGVIIKDYEVQP